MNTCKYKLDEKFCALQNTQGHTFNEGQKFPLDTSIGSHGHDTCFDSSKSNEYLLNYAYTMSSWGTNAFCIPVLRIPNLLKTRKLCIWIYAIHDSTEIYSYTKYTNLLIQKDKGSLNPSKFALLERQSVFRLILTWYCQSWGFRFPNFHSQNIPIPSLIAILLSSEYVCQKIIYKFPLNLCPCAVEL